MVNVGEDNFLKQMKKIKFLILISTLLIYNSCKSVSYQKNNELCSCFESFFHELNNFELNSLHYLSGLDSLNVIHNSINLGKCKQISISLKNKPQLISFEYFNKVEFQSKLSKIRLPEPDDINKFIITKFEYNDKMILIHFYQLYGNHNGFFQFSRKNGNVIDYNLGQS